MTIETELKLHISPGHMQKLKRHPWLRNLSATPARAQKLYSIYYDTGDLELRRHAMALRLRRVGRQFVQTLKGGGQVSAGLHQRNEWESAVPSEQLDFEALEACGGELPRGVRNRLQPVFVTDFSRNVRTLSYEGAEIELCMDSGEIRAGQSSCPISELELELKSGEPQQLFKLALALLNIVPLDVEHTSKAEYGYLLFSASKPSASKGRFPVLKRSQPIAGALRDMIAACLTHVQSNVPGALLKLDEEYLHQVRVGLRRLRVVLAIALRFNADAELAALREQVAELCVDLGRSREWDVFVTQTLAPICARLPEHAGLHEVLSASERARKKQLAGMESSLASQDFQRMLLRFGAWMQGTPAIEPELTLERFARQTLEKRSKQVLRNGVALAGEDAAQLHALRIACKKLRYSIEMFASLFNDAKVRNCVVALVELQDILGILNDIAVANRLLDKLDNAARHDTLALIRGWMEHDYAQRVAEFGKAWNRFAAQKGFWN
ncbi:CYTH and CHAD domain-containing protein [Sideroxydans lithotrophicus]|uniref:CHAD domain containing protein n=1 Tax=Sideroxydans lithotrophicus (strain ES-1) TaxID=580332 RepID=D5CS18_SIDLE|nr:CYTH and CHAD domain-containing protein [Sideroxydans lithotrophicus]ADE11754.1 CHAD domain containing protein [Sideroxydans lithotrophicus ES-1]